MESVQISTSDRTSVLDITDRVETTLADDREGTVTVFVKHTTAGITVNEAESRLLGDFERALETLVDDGGWEHDEIDDNADAHVRSLLIGPSTTIPVADGTLQLGRWQSVLLVECDGPRTRTVTVV